MKTQYYIATQNLLITGTFVNHVVAQTGNTQKITWNATTSADQHHVWRSDMCDYAKVSKHLYDKYLQRVTNDKSTLTVREYKALTK